MVSRVCIKNNERERERGARGRERERVLLHFLVPIFYHAETILWGAYRETLSIVWSNFTYRNIKILSTHPIIS